MKEPAAPVRTDDPIGAIQITGYFMPVDANQQPKWLQVPGSDSLYLPIFSTPEKAEEVMAQVGLGYDRLTKITDGTAWLESIPFFFGMTPLVIMLDPHTIENGKVRWCEIQRSQA